MPNSQETRDAVTGTSPQVAEYIVRQFSESMPHIVWFADGTGAVTYCNQHGLTYFGIDLEDMTAWRWDKLLHPDDLPPVLLAWEAARLGQTRYTVYYRLRRYDGVFRWFLCSAEPQKDTAGNVLRWCGNSVDIEDGKATEEKARLAEHEMRLALDTTPLTLLRMDAVGKYSMVAGPALKNLGLDAKAMLGLQASEVFGKEHPIAALFERALALGGDVQGEAAYNDRYLDIRLQPILSRDNKLEGVTGVMVDITERRVHERLVASEKAAQEASELKAQFLANMSHEVRTPLGGVLGMTDLLLDTPLTEEQRRLADMIQSSGRGLLAVLNDILDFSKLDAGKVQLEPENFEITTFVENQAELMSAKAHEKGLSLMTYVDPALPAVVRADSVRIGQILLNFLSNAIKFTQQGSVIVRASPVTAQSGAGSKQAPKGSLAVRLSVTDSGIGIDAETQQRLFQPFVQADASTARRYGGTGLGLSISHRLAELMGGTIGVDSTAGQGATFYVIVPVEIATEQQLADDAVWPSLAGKRVLAVEDDPAALFIVAQYLRAAGAEVVEARCGSDAVELFAQSTWQQATFDAVLIDKRLPDMDGFQTLQQMQAKVTMAKPRFVLMTAYSLRREAQVATTEGFAAYLTKPLRRIALLRCLAQSAEAVADDTATSVAAVAVHEPTQVTVQHHTGRILVAEDNRVNQLIICAQLKKLGHTVTAVANGREAVEALANGTYDLVFMDCQMPVLDGYAATRTIRANADATRPHMPIIALTANAMREDKERCLAAGMDDYVSKPFTPATLRAVMDSWFPAAPT